ncbi:putative beta-lysine N-acetyltransferase [Methanocorpusculum bavaricum]|nr:putative beta-lysine N-acetyltransferase [Methanocorpusculum bavaricum]MDD2248959.1 putative beta-lysine N-acetyltransferase [Methanocorpusculum sp.]MDD2803431.1 putative beta-lysine N-acetyltransferase [Methanocorpusculum sp.]MDD3912538.1 putative beta-lysine N-acetyltransferase [Methanocorpusculum sp.]MDD4423766.1 putative beta-lysine N-acetyltransferase [Methanocorpusculum parvum]
MKYGNSILQHGRFNNRIYIMTLAENDLPGIIGFADDLAKRENYTKIFGKVPASSADMFASAGYVVEASIPSFFQGKEEAVFMAKYFDPERRKTANATELTEIRAAALEHTGRKERGSLPNGFTLRPARTEDTEKLADLFRKVFPTYPFPISDPEYIRTNMQDNVRYFLIKEGDKIAAASSCEVDKESLTAEMTDFAVDPHYRGRSFAGILLEEMEKTMRREGIITAYTIARSASLPMNAVFAGAGYRFGGMLPNNTNISGSIESMNTWYKKL